MEKKLGTVVLVVVTEGSGFVAGAGGVVVVGLAKKFGIAGCTGVGTVVEGVGTGVGVVNKFFAGSLVSVIVGVLIAGFGCVGAAEAGVVKLWTAVGVVEVVTRVGAGEGEGFFSSSTTFFDS